MTEKTEIIPIKLDDETTLQASVVKLGGEEDVGIKDLLFSEVMETIQSLSTSLATTLRKANPHKASIEFSLGLAAKEGQLTALLIQGGGNASFKITLEWTGGE